MKKLTTQEFIEKARKVHGDKYDYSMTTYTIGSNNVDIICPIHGLFSQQASNHLFGQGCPICGKELTAKKRTLEIDFVELAKKVHGDKYNYSKVNYVNKKTKVCIICPEHGDFWQLPYLHLKGCGCPTCGIEKTVSHTRKTKEQFITQATKTHNGKYDYSKVNYKNSEQKVEIICPIHGSFFQTPSSHLAGRGCPDCSGHKRKDTEKFISEARKIHGDFYDYSLVDYENKCSRVKIICPIHGVFEQKAENHLMGRGCSLCKRSIGEERVALILDKYNVEYVTQYALPNTSLLCTNRTLYIDFYIKKRNTIIEYNGVQHYRPIEQFGGKEQFELQQERDMALRQYCKEHKIKLIEIPYLDFDNIETILKKELKLK
jgi:hypothetical protein